MASIDDYFNIDDKHNITIHSTNELTGGDGLTLPIRMYQNLAAGAYYFSIRIPSVQNPLKYCLEMINSNLIDSVKNALPKVTVSSQRPTLHGVNTESLRFCGRIYIYSDVELDRESVDLIHSEGMKKNLFVEYFGPSWALARSEMEKPLAFISHDSRDKKEIARPLALKLSGIGVPVWFDEFSLKIGDSLRESIERGIKKSNYCILVVTKNFITNEGWTKTEFNSIFTKEMIQREKIILPIWHNVSKEEVYEYSPTLVDRLAAKWDEGEDIVAAKIKSKIKG